MGADIYVVTKLESSWKTGDSLPVKKREVNEPFYDALLTLFNCTFLNSQATFKRKSNLKITKKFEKKRKVDKNACKATFSQRYN